MLGLTDLLQIPSSDVKHVLSRTSIAVSPAGDMLVIGIMRRDTGGYPYLLGLATATGKPIYATLLDPHPAAIVTMSPTIYSGSVYVGLSSLEELRAAQMDYKCCDFRGSMVKVYISLELHV
jgi:polyvinyl alcohol dehydrogenase (cytochrome)